MTQKAGKLKQQSILIGILAIALSSLLLSTSACTRTRSGPPTVSTTSTTGDTLKQRIQFVEKYVTFRRDYIELEYSIDYHNNGGSLVPGPSDWDIKLIAVVPKQTIDNWVPPNTIKSDPPSKDWVTTIAQEIKVDGIDEWYSVGNSIAIGLDRKSGIVAYRNSTM